MQGLKCYHVQTDAHIKHLQCRIVHEVASSLDTTPHTES